MDIMTAIAAGTKAIEALKGIQDLNKAYDAATWKAKVAELMSDIADMKIALIASPYQASAGCATAAGSRRTRLAPPGRVPVLS